MFIFHVVAFAHKRLLYILLLHKIVVLSYIYIYIYILVWHAWFEFSDMQAHWTNLIGFYLIYIPRSYVPLEWA
jgi:hypothetical protein